MMHPFMPFVTEEIYGMLPIKDSTSIMISDYPKYEEEFVYDDVIKKYDYIIDFVRLFRNVKLENQMTKDLKVKINNNEDYSLIKKILKIEDSIIDTELNITKFNISNNVYNVDVYFEKEITKEDEELKNKQIEQLKASINRRKGLLANENYVNKAPHNLVEQEKQKLLEEEKLLEEMVK